MHPPHLMSQVVLTDVSPRVAQEIRSVTLARMYLRMAYMGVNYFSVPPPPNKTNHHILTRAHMN